MDWIHCVCGLGVGGAGVVLVSCRGHCDEFWQADEVIGGDGEGEDGCDFGFASDFDAVVSGLSFDPTEHFLDAFSAAQADGIAGVAGGPRVDGGLADLAKLADGALHRDMWRHPARPQFGDCGFRGDWAVISRDAGHAFHAILGSHFTGSWAGWPTFSWSQA